jgi:hypothetical protein
LARQHTFPDETTYLSENFPKRQNTFRMNRKYLLITATAAIAVLAAGVFLLR